MSKVEVGGGINTLSGKRQPQIVYCVRPLYGFRVARSGENSTYTLLGIDREPMFPFFFDFETGRFLTGGFALLGKPLIDVLQKPKTQIVEATEIVVKGQKLYQVILQWQTTPKERHVSNSEIPTYYTGKILLEPQRDWAIVRAEVENGERGSLRPAFLQEATFDVGSDGRAIPRVVSIRIYIDPIVTRSLEFQQIEFRGTPESEFTLTHYGLPDPEPAPRGWGREILLGTLAAIVALSIVVGLLLRRSSRRRASLA